MHANMQQVMFMGCFPHVPGDSEIGCYTYSPLFIPAYLFNFVVFEIRKKKKSAVLEKSG
jgi:hypothetical protein